MSLTVSEADLKKFAKRAHPEYVAAILGVSRWRTPYQVQQDKLGADTYGGNLLTEAGDALEPDA